MDELLTTHLSSSLYIPGKLLFLCKPRKQNRQQTACRYQDCLQSQVTEAGSLLLVRFVEALAEQFLPILSSSCEVKKMQNFVKDQQAPSLRVNEFQVS